jgi:ATP-dependent Clp protease ATP-binding subunit ClpB
MAVDPARWTLKTQEAMQAAIDAARSASNPEVTPEHLLLALLGQEGTAALPVLQKVGVAPLSLRNRLGETVARLPRSYGGADPQLSRPLRDVLERADGERQDLSDEYLSVEHLLLALAGDIGTDREGLLEALKDVRGSHRVTSQNPEEAYQALEKYGRDLTEEARKGKLDPVIGRDEEIRRVIQVLSRRTKNNPVLIGEPGVGKTGASSRSGSRPC